MNVQRYDLHSSVCLGMMIPRPDGDWVEFTTLTALEAEVARLREALLAIERMVYPEPIVVEKLPAGPGVLADEVGMHGPWHGVRLANGELRGWGRYGGYCIDVSSVGLPMPHAVDLAKMARTALAPAAQKDVPRG